MKKALYSLAVAVFMLFTATANAQVVYETVDVVSGFKASTTPITLTDTLGEEQFYRATLTDFGFFDNFYKMGMMVSSSTQSYGSIIGPGSFDFEAAPGNYYVTFAGIAGTNPAGGVSTYGIQIALVPEIETWIMMIIGLGIVGYMIRRRANRETENFNACAA